MSTVVFPTETPNSWGFDRPKTDPTTSSLANIANRARTILERVEHLSAARLEPKTASTSRPVDQAPAVEANRSIQARRDRWCQVVTGGNWERFRRFIEWRGWDFDSLPAVLGDDQDAAHDGLPASDLPAWTGIVAEIAELFVSATDKQQIIDDGGVEDKLPFQDLLQPMVLAGRRRLKERLDENGIAFPLNEHALSSFSRDAYLKLEDWLTTRLAQLCTPALFEEFDRFRPAGQTLLSRLTGGNERGQSTEFYHAFINKIRNDPLCFFEEYPVLARYVATAVENWVEATAEFIKRFEQDLETIVGLFGFADHQPKIVDLDAGRSDPHRGGRTVIVLLLQSGDKLVYKPKDLGLEVAFNKLLAWINDQGVKPSFKPFKVLNRETYGWVEFVEAMGCQDAGAARRFYERAGMLLALLYVLGATDCHYENLIAHGEHLVLTDLETLLHHDIKAIPDTCESTDHTGSVIEYFWDSVLRTGLLPCWEFGSDHKTAFDVSGLGSLGRQQMPRSMPRWTAINTDGMTVTTEIVETNPDANVPQLNGQSLDPDQYVAELVAGFECMYRLLVAHRETTSPSPLEAFRNQNVRFVFRNTRVYCALMHMNTDASVLRSGIDASIELDAVNRAFMLSEEEPPAWPLAESELRSLQRLDVPYFAAKSDSSDLTVGVDVNITDFFASSSYDQMTSRLASLSEDDLAHQVALIRGSFCARSSRAHVSSDQRTGNSTPAVRKPELLEKSELAATDWLRGAASVVDELREQAIRESDGSAHWIGLSYEPDTDRMRFAPVGNRFYDGNLGISLFLAAFSDATENSAARELAYAAIQRYTSSLLESPVPEAPTDREVKLGGAVGIGSVVYSLTKIGEFLSDQELIDCAFRAARLISNELIGADNQLDVIQGSAGAILGLLSLHRISNDRQILETAKSCGEHLLNRRSKVGPGLFSWRTLDGEPLTGFSHGASGIVFALLRLASATNDKRFYTAAVEGINYERSVFSPTHRNWPDLRRFKQREGQISCACSWCHGAPGIGLSRAAAFAENAEAIVVSEIEDALKTTVNVGASPVDHVCCGNGGLIETLLESGRVLNRPEWIEAAELRAASMLCRAESRGHYSLYENIHEQVFNPGFFQGTAGIGYLLLRLANPDLPCALLWD